MNRIARGAAAGLLFGWALAAQAATNYSADLLLQPGLPALRVGSPTLDGPHNVDGAWTSQSRPDASAYTKDESEATALGSANGQRYLGDPRTMGESLGQSWLLDRNSSALAYVGYTGIGVDGYQSGSTSEIKASGGWSRDFALNAGASFTFAALVTLGIAGDDAPLDLTTIFTADPAASFASLVMSDLAGRVGAQLTASLYGFSGGTLLDYLSYSYDPSGLLSLTISNTTSGALFGTLGARAYVDVSAPIPEPGHLSLAALGLLALVVRSRMSRAETR